MKMKKLLVVALLLLSSWVEAQSTLKAVSLTYGSRVSESESFTWDKQGDDLFIPVHISEDNVITIYSEVVQRYVAISTGEDIDEYSTMWKTIDVNGKRCDVYITNVDGALYLLISYKNYGWFYELVEY